MPSIAEVEKSFAESPSRPATLPTAMHCAPRRVRPRRAPDGRAGGYLEILEDFDEF
jgi:hypothetical protein